MYPHMVLSFSNFLMVAAWFIWQQGKVSVRLNTVSTTKKVYLEPSLRGREPI